jgi:hypothetical protein
MTPRANSWLLIPSENRLEGFRSIPNEIGWWYSRRTISRNLSPMLLRWQLRLLLFCTCSRCVLHFVYDKQDKHFPTPHMAENDGFYYCDCSKYCKRRKKVSSTTWYAHKRYHDAMATTFGDFEASKAGTSFAARQPEAGKQQSRDLVHHKPSQKKRKLGLLDQHQVPNDEIEVNFCLGPAPRSY